MESNWNEVKEEELNLRDPNTIEAVWCKGQHIKGFSPGEWRCDACGNLIKRIEYGNRDSDYGWEIDHIDPDGGDFLSNLRPLYWKTNVQRN